MAAPSPASGEAARRRTLAIISHPDAGKTTLTEKLLLYTGSIGVAGSVTARGDRRAATSDWMEIERQRGISISSAAVQFEYRNVVCNLLDTPGHRDFSEDTYRVLAAADAAIMLIDAAKGVELQTLKLFEVARDRGLPILTFVNKFDRPGRDALELLDDVEASIGLIPVPLTWPVGIAGDFRGVIDRAHRDFIAYERVARGASIAPEVVLDAEAAAAQAGEAWTTAIDEIGLLEATGTTFDAEAYRAGIITPVLWGSALTNFGVRTVLDAIVDYVPAPEPRIDTSGEPRALDAGFSAMVFKVQSNMDPAHRDRIAFVRVASGEFERGMSVTNARTGRAMTTKYAHKLFAAARDTVETAFAGDIVGLVNATDLRVGDTLYADRAVEFPRIPGFLPEQFVAARSLDSSKAKQFRKGIDALDEEGVVQVLSIRADDVEVTLGAVGALQFEVAKYRLESEFHAVVELHSLGFNVAARTDEESALTLGSMAGVTIARRRDGTVLALFENDFWLRRHRDEHPELLLDSGVVG